jgi:hypothetical protein
MKKSKKYTYPFIFSIYFFATYIILAIMLNIVFSGDYAGFGYAGIALILWILVAIPFYCFKYSKLIYEEKWKFLFIIYNSLVIALCYTGPFLIPAIQGSDDADVIIKIAIALFSWVLICTYVSYLIRINIPKKPSEDNLNETKDNI